MLYNRLIIKEIEASILNTQINIILGPRQVGKSTLVKQLLKYPIENLYLDLELLSDEIKLSDPESFISRNIDKIIIIDEVQRKPELFPLLRGMVDKYVASRFILLGSASEDVFMKSSESLAGRSAYYELEPLNIWEVGEEHIDDIWLRGGFPKAFLNDTYSDAKRWLNQFIKSYIERELSISYLKASPILLEKFLQLLTSIHGQLSNYSMIGTSFDISVPTVKRYIDFFESKYILRVLYPFHVNIGKRLIKSPKIYFRDSGLLHVLRGLESFEQLQGDILKGHSWEGFVIQQIVSVISIDVHAYFYRTADGAELDLILLKGNQIKIGFEIKYSNSPKLSSSVHTIIDDLQIPVLLVVTPSSDEFQIAEKIRICPLKNVINHLRTLKMTLY